ncbi:delta5 fatty acid desaturase [Neoconidiobolus thromboides FSU 785]|nr:delta5 fatty acid desaturase [Neoconidiobolus thromboides FSU 785]
MSLEFSWEELAKHNTQESLYIAVRGKVYDVTKFIKYHPGGYETLLVGGGRDCTIVFETYHQYEQLVKVLQKYEIGTLVSNELPTFPKPNKFQMELKDKVYDYFQQNKKDEKTVNLLIRYGWIYTGLLFSYYYSLSNANNIYVSMLFSLSLGFFCAQVGLHPLHDSSHFAITHNPTIWKVLGLTHDLFNGCSNLVWIYQHMLGHHPYTNIPNADPDISVNDPDVRRILPQQEYLEKYIGQERYVPLLYGFLAVKTRLQDILIVYFEKKNSSIRINPLTLTQHLTFWFGKFFFVFYRIILPYFIVGMNQMIINLILSDMVASYWLAITFQVNHVTSTLEYIEMENNDKLIQMDWAEMQFKTTQDYSHESNFWTTFTGGLNYQTIHHIFPNIHQAYYPQLSALIQSVCKKHGVEYIVQEDFTTAFKSHIDLLKQLGISKDFIKIKSN